MSEFLIQNGLIFDGTPQPARHADLLIRDGRIVRIAEQGIAVEDAPNAELIDAGGKWVLPGFIDNHTHYDGEVLVAPTLGESVRHGVTSVILGGCSLSFVYADAEDCCDMFTRVEAFPREVLLPILSQAKTWQDPAAWRAHIHTLPLGPNLASFIGHSDIRARVMGLDRSLDPAIRPEPAEIDSMAAMLSEALDQGFLGISMQHNPWDKMDGRHWSKLLPAAYAGRQERNALTAVARERGAHLQGVPNLVNRVAAFWYMAQSASFGRRKPLRTSLVAMMNLKGDPYIRPLISGIAGFFNRRLGADFRLQTFPVPFRTLAQGMELVIFEEFPTGALARHLAKDKIERDKMLADPEYRERFKRHYCNKLAPKIWQKDFGDAYVLAAPDPDLIGKSFTQISEARGQHPVDTFLDLVIDLDRELLWETTIGNHDPEAYGPLYNDPNGIFGFADSGAHIDNLAFYNFPLRVLRYVKASHERGKPLMPLEKAVWRLTKENAEFFGIDAGHLAPGKRADLVILNPEQLDDKVHDYHRERFLGGHTRLVNRNDAAVDTVMINGRIAWRDQAFSPDFGRVRFGSFLPGRQTQPSSPEKAQLAFKP